MQHVDNFYFGKASDSNANDDHGPSWRGFFLLFPSGGIVCFDLCANVLDERQLLNPIIIGYKEKPQTVNLIKPVKKKTISRAAIIFCSFPWAAVIQPLRSDKWAPSIQKRERHHFIESQISSNLTVLCGTVKPSVWMSWDIAMCVEGSSCSTWRAEWCEQEVTRGFAVCGALLALLQPGTPTYLWFQFNGIIKDSLSGPLSAVLVVFAWGWPWLRGWLWRPQIRLLMSFKASVVCIQDVLIWRLSSASKPLSAHFKRNRRSSSQGCERPPPSLWHVRVIFERNIYLPFQRLKRSGRVL